MKITRSSKCYFNKWLTKSKMSELKDILQEYARVCNKWLTNKNIWKNIHVKF